MTEVLTVAACGMDAVASLLHRFGLTLRSSAEAAPIEGSYWGDREAGLVGNNLFARVDTPLHSVLHEACHFICMDEKRRYALERDAGGDHDEENGVCYLQILLADEIQGCDRTRMMTDMDAWGYTFRLGAARAWFEQDAEDARTWLLNAGLIDAQSRVTWRVRI